MRHRRGLLLVLIAIAGGCSASPQSPVPDQTTRSPDAGPGSPDSGTVRDGPQSGDAPPPPPPPPPHQSFLSAVWGSAKNDVWAVGMNGSIMHHDGKSWTGIQIDKTINLRAVWGSGPNDVYAGGEALYRYDGTSWKRVTLSLQRVYGIWGSSANDVYAVGTKTSYVKSTGVIAHFDGKSWTEVNGGAAQPPQVTPPWEAAFTAIWGSSATDVFVVGYRQSNYSAPPPAGSTVIEPAYIWHYDGTTWSGGLAEGASWTIGALRSVWGSGPADVYAVGDTSSTKPSGTILHFDGKSWSKQSASPAGAFAGVWGTGGTVIAVGAVADPGPSFKWAGLWRLGASGSWTAQSVPATHTLTGIWGSAVDDVFVVGPAGMIMHYDGKAWALQSGSP